MCRDDPLFWFGVFAWTYDPRKKPPGIVFIPYEFQAKAFLEILNAIDGQYDLLIEKSRDMGASWLSVLAFTYLWMFVPGQSFLCVSRKEELVDKKGDPKALFWKVDYVLKKTPHWMLDPRWWKLRKAMHIEHPVNGSVIDGESTTGDSGRGDRRRAILLDEFAHVEDGPRVLSATADATGCRLFNSTPNGRNHFYDLRANPDMQILRIHWTDHPEKAEGLYLDEEGKPRSPWYDKECKRRSMIEVSEQLDIDYTATGAQFFLEKEIEDHIRSCCLPPTSTGEVIFDAGALEVRRVDSSLSGPWKFWTDLPASTNDEYVIGIDVSAGTGGTCSHSVMSLWSAVKRKKVAEFVSNTIRPNKLALLAVSIAKYFSGQGQGAYLIWESNGGPGQQFTQDVIATGYRRFFMRRSDDTLTKTVSNEYAGFYLTRERKEVLLSEYRAKMAAKEISNSSIDAVKECRDYAYRPNGAIGPIANPSSRKAEEHETRHGDRVMADAYAVRGLEEMKTSPVVETKKAMNSVGGRLEKLEAELKARQTW